jgi:CheY-like chemotaxis protein
MTMEATPIKVMLVDDDPSACDVFRLVMKHYDYPILVAEDAETALGYLQTYQPDVIVLDIFLPGLDGYQALKHIRREALAPASRVVATTAYYTSDTEQEALRQGFDGYLAKPFDPNALVKFLRDVVARGK